MQIVLNSSPLIFLAKLGYLNQFLESPDDFYIPQSVADEIGAKSDPASQAVQALINSNYLQVRASNLTTLANSLNQRLGKGESEAIALGIELDADYVLLDDSTARRLAGIAVIENQDIAIVQFYLRMLLGNPVGTNLPDNIPGALQNYAEYNINKTLPYQYCFHSHEF